MKWKMEKATLDFRIYKIWQILKYFVGTCHQSINLVFLKSLDSRWKNWNSHTHLWFERIWKVKRRPDMKINIVRWPDTDILCVTTHKREIAFFYGQRKIKICLRLWRTNSAPESQLARKFKKVQSKKVKKLISPQL